MRSTKELEETATGHLVVSLAKNIDDDKEEVVKELFLVKEKPAKERKCELKELRKLQRV